MDRKWSVGSVVAALSVVSLSCEIAEAADPGFYIGAAGGRSEQRLDKRAGIGPIAVADFGTPQFGTPIFLAPPAFGGVAAFVAAQPEIEADESDVGWDFALGYRVNKYFAAELTYMESGEATLIERYEPLPTSLPVTALGVERSYSVNTRGPKLSLLGSLPLGSEWEAFVRGGVLFAKQEVTSRFRVTNSPVPGASSVDSDFNDEVVSVGAGVQWNFLPRWTARLEYQRTDDLQRNQVMGESRLDQASLSILFGL